MLRRALLAVVIAASYATASEYHVSVKAGPGGDGSATKPFQTIMAAAAIAHGGDVITTHEGIYRERINPPRGGTSDTSRITYQAAPGEKVDIRGSEVISNWAKEQRDTWKAVVPNSLFGKFNPYSDEIRGDWFSPLKRVHHTGAVYLNGHWLIEAASLDKVMEPAGETGLWFAKVDPQQTTIWAQFKNVNPNEQLVEINVRQTVFYPDKPGRNYITVRGFALRHAATPWAPPTAEQIGLIGTHWSKGWIIENNTVSHSICSGISLGKHGDQFDNTSANTAEGYVKTIERAHAHAIPWTRENIGHHIVRNNVVSHCEQAGIVGSLGCAFSTVTGNVIHDIHVRRLFSGAEMAGIKFHAAIDAEISQNHIYRTARGLWLDWMAQGTRVTRNVFHDNGPAEDLYVEVNHGPFLVDNNIFLSTKALLDMSEGGAYAHNLVTGKIIARPEPRRQTPYHPPHSTVVAGLAQIGGGDSRFFNNIFVQNTNLAEAYMKAAQPLQSAGNLYLAGAQPPKVESDPQVIPSYDPAVVKPEEKSDGWYLHVKVDAAWLAGKRPLVTSDVLGKTLVSKAGYDRPDGTPVRVDIDFFGKPRNPSNPFPGPFEAPGTGSLVLKVAGP